MEDASFNDGFRAPKRRKKKTKEGQNTAHRFPQKRTPSEVLVHQLESNLAELHVSYDQYAFKSIDSWKKKISESSFWKGTIALECFSQSKPPPSSTVSSDGFQICSVDRIVCLGLGSMASIDFGMRRSRPQFAFLLMLRDLVQSHIAPAKPSESKPYVSVCEPMLTAEDVALITHFQISILENVCGSYPVPDPLPIAIKSPKGLYDRSSDDDPGITIFWMPHCPKELYASVLRANWSPSSLSRIIIIGNSFHNIVTSLPSETDRITLGRVFAAHSVASIFPLPEYSEDPYIFNNTCVHIFNPPTELTATDPFWTIPTEEDLALRNVFGGNSTLEEKHVK